MLNGPSLGGGTSAGAGVGGGEAAGEGTAVGVGIDGADDAEAGPDPGDPGEPSTGPLSVATGDEPARTPVPSLGTAPVDRTEPAGGRVTAPTPEVSEQPTSAPIAATTISAAATLRNAACPSMSPGMVGPRSGPVKPTGAAGHRRCRAGQPRLALSEAL